jgi:hypothetical protein
LYFLKRITLTFAAVKENYLEVNILIIGVASIQNLECQANEGEAEHHFTKDDSQLGGHFYIVTFYSLTKYLNLFSDFF